VSVQIRPEFRVHKLNAEGLDKAKALAELFSMLLESVERVSGVEGRDMALVRTHLELASFYGKRAMASKPENQAT
jgi:hypothetical protein